MIYILVYLIIGIIMTIIYLPKAKKSIEKDFNNFNDIEKELYLKWKDTPAWNTLTAWLCILILPACLPVRIVFLFMPKGDKNDK